MADQRDFSYLYFRLVEYVGDLPECPTTAEVGKWQEDQTILNFLAHRANLPSNRKLVDGTSFLLHSV